MIMKTTQILEGVQQIVNDFLLDNGGYENGYETYVTGLVGRDIKDGISDLCTPTTGNISLRMVIELRQELELMIMSFINKNQILHDIKIDARHMEYGCFNIEISVVQKISFTCKKRVDLFDKVKPLNLIEMTKDKLNTNVPADWKARSVDLKSGWKNNSHLLAEIVSAINDEIYIEDENEEMEKIDIVLDWIAKRYDVSKRQ